MISKLGIDDFPLFLTHSAAGRRFISFRRISIRRLNFLVAPTELSLVACCRRRSVGFSHRLAKKLISRFPLVVVVVVGPHLDRSTREYFFLPLPWLVHFGVCLLIVDVGVVHRQASTPEIMIPPRIKTQQ